MTPEERLDAQLTEFVDLSALVSSSLDPRVIRRRAVEAAARLVDAERASLLLLDGKRGWLYFEVALGDGTESLRHVHLAPGEGIAGSVLSSRRGEKVNDVRGDSRHYVNAGSDTGFVTRNMLAIPLTCHGESLGVLEIINKRDGEFTDDDLMIAAALAGQIAIAVQNAALYERLRRAYLETWAYAAVLASVLMAAGGWLLAVTR